MKKIIFSVCSVLVALSILIGFLAHRSFTDIINSTNKTQSAIAYDSLDWVSNEYLVEEITKTAESLDNCELIAIVDFSGERLYEHLSTKSSVTVQNILKGDKSLENTKIYLYEPCYYYFDALDNSLRYMPVSSFTLMNSGEKYLIFADKVEYSDNKPKYISNNTYIFHNENLPYVCIENGKALSAEKCNFPLLFEDIEQYEFVCENNKEAQKIKSIKMDILNKYIPKG